MNERGTADTVSTNETQGRSRKVRPGSRYEVTARVTFAGARGWVLADNAEEAAAKAEALEFENVWTFFDLKGAEMVDWEITSVTDAE